MIKGELGPELPQVRYYKHPVPAKLKYLEMDKDPFPTPEEAQVWFQLGDRRKTAFVPLRIVNEANGTVTASLVGESQGKIVVSFPPTNFGRTRFAALESELDAIAVENP